MMVHLNVLRIAAFLARLWRKLSPALIFSGISTNAISFALFFGFRMRLALFAHILRVT